LPFSPRRSAPALRGEAAQMRTFSQMRDSSQSRIVVFKRSLKAPLAAGSDPWEGV